MQVWSVEYPDGKGGIGIALFLSKELAEDSVRYSCHKLPPEQIEEEVKAANIKPRFVYETVEHL